MPVVFPHASSQSSISYIEFVAAWQAMADIFGPPDWDWRSDPMPRCHRRECLSDLLDKSLHFSVDVLCRCLVPGSYRNTMHATGEFMDNNEHLLISQKAVNPASDQRVMGARLTDAALEAWDRASAEARQRLIEDARKKLQPVEDAPAPVRAPARTTRAPVSPSEKSERETEEELLPPAQPRPIPEDLTGMAAEALRGEKLETLLRALVEWIAREPYQPFYRKAPLGDPVMGWPERLLRYFWPDPDLDYHRTHTLFAPLLDQAEALAKELEEQRVWPPAMADSAIELTHEILKWGQVPQDDVDQSQVRKVFWNALQDRIVYDDAPMNSGWTKIAAFATAHLEGAPDRHPQAIWDSRVSTAIIWRLDQLLTAANADQVPRPLRDVGYVIGRGGSRPRALHLNWSHGYGKWRAQFAGSDVVKWMRDILHEGRRPGTAERYPAMPRPGGGTGKWTLRGVEMVLFGDGY